MLAALVLGFLLSSPQSRVAQPPEHRPHGYISLPGAPFGIAPTPDGAWVFVALTGNGQTGIAVLRRTAAGLQVEYTIPLAQPPTGIVITHDAQLLIAVAGSLIYFLDVASMTSNGAQPVLGSISDGNGAGSIDVNVTADDHWLFVADENFAQITVIDLNRARSGGYSPASIVGSIPTGVAPTQIEFSEDGEWRYSTSELALPSWGWPAACIQGVRTRTRHWSTHKERLWSRTCRRL